MVYTLVMQLNNTESGIHVILLSLTGCNCLGFISIALKQSKELTGQEFLYLLLYYI